MSAACHQFVQIRYLGHSAWLVETSRHVLVFDYGSRPARPDLTQQTGSGLAVNGRLDPPELVALASQPLRLPINLSLPPQPRPILTFASHRHTDHDNPAWQAALREAVLQHETVLSGDLSEGTTNDAGEVRPSSLTVQPAPLAGPVLYSWLGLDLDEPVPIPAQPGLLYMRPGQCLASPDSQLDLTIATTFSTDQGVAFLLRLPELTIYFGGDLAVWADTPAYREQHEKALRILQGLAWPVDLAFIPVSTSDGFQEAQLLHGARDVVRRLQPRWVLPMHAHGFTRFYQRFATWLRCNEPAFSGSILIAREPGDWQVIDLAQHMPPADLAMHPAAFA